MSREIVTDEFDALYAQLKAKGVTVSAMLAKACAEVLKKHPIVNAAYVNGAIKYSKDINVAMAVAIDGGLITPTIAKAGDKDLFSVSRDWKQLVEKAKAKKLTPAEYSSGTFTISNLGMFGVSQFDAILPPGTGAILAIAASTPKVIQVEGKLLVQKSMTVTITADHRHIYGADVAEFLKDLAGEFLAGSGPWRTWSLFVSVDWLLIHSHPTPTPPQHRAQREATKGSSDGLRLDRQEEILHCALIDFFCPLRAYSIASICTSSLMSLDQDLVHERGEQPI